MKKIKINYLISLISSLVVCIIFLPIQVLNGERTFYGTTTIFNYLITNDDMCINCYNYKISWLTLVIEFMVIFFISLLLLKLIDKRRKK